MVAQVGDHDGALALDFQERKRGFALMALAITLLATMDLLVKLLSTRYAVTQIVWARYVLQSLTFVAVTGVVGIAASLRSDFLPAHLGRAALLLVGNVSFVLALRYLPLTEANVIGFASPLIITALSYPVLGQRVSARRWLAVIVGFAGILIVMQPGQSLFQWAALWPLAMAATAAVYHITTPLIGRHDDPVVSVYILSVAGAVVLTVAVPFAWTTPGPSRSAGPRRHRRARRLRADSDHQGLHPVAGRVARPVLLCLPDLGRHLRLPGLRRRPNAYHLHRRRPRRRRRHLRLQARLIKGGPKERKGDRP
jgi:hypothetical protein